jgi:hypothetical protein
MTKDQSASALVEAAPAIRDGASRQRPAPEPASHQRGGVRDEANAGENSRPSLLDSGSAEPPYRRSLFRR